MPHQPGHGRFKADREECGDGDENQHPAGRENDLDQGVRDGDTGGPGQPDEERGSAIEPRSGPPERMRGRADARRALLRGDDRLLLRGGMRLGHVVVVAPGARGHGRLTTLSRRPPPAVSRPMREHRSAAVDVPGPVVGATGDAGVERQ